MSKLCPVFIPFAGCNNKCIYCDQNSLTGFSKSDIIKSIISQINNVNTSGNFEKIAFFGGSFSCLSPSLRKEIYKISSEYGFRKIRVSTRPDCINNEIIEEMKENFVTDVELGIQTLNEEALVLNLRPYNPKQTLEALELCCQNFYTVAQVMPGLYGDNTDEFLNGFKILLSLKPDAFRIYPTVIFRNTRLEEYYKKGKYTPTTLNKALQISLYCTSECISNSIEILRTGIPTENLYYADIIAGPFHPAFGDLVRTLAVMLYFSESGDNVISPKDNMQVAGYKSIVKKLSLYKITDRKDIGRFNIEMAYKFIREQFIEGNFRLFEGPTDYFAQILQDKTHHR